MNQINIIVLLSVLSILPLLAVICTSFLKISVVLLFLRESLALQQIPPNIVIYGMAIILSFYTMGPVFNAITDEITNLQYNSSQAPAASDLVTLNSLSTFSQSATQIIVPLKQFLTDNSLETNKEFFFASIKKMWRAPYADNIQKSDMVILIPAFMVTQLNEAFKIGFLLYLPSLIIDIFISNLLLALGMMMMSPMTLSTPIKLLLFILIGGWGKVINLLFNSFIIH